MDVKTNGLVLPISVVICIKYDVKLIKLPFVNFKNAIIQAKSQVGLIVNTEEIVSLHMNNTYSASRFCLNLENIVQNVTFK